jgi:hypothetical protein
MGEGKQEILRVQSVQEGSYRLVRKV